jgi:hypothetical protein
MLTGIPAAPLEQVRETLQAQVSLQFLSWTKLTMALATGSQHMNVLAARERRDAWRRMERKQLPAVTPQSGSTSTSICWRRDAAKFHAGIDRRGGRGLHRADGIRGTPVAGAYVRQALTDVDYMRRVTFNVALVSQVTRQD